MASLHLILILAFHIWLKSKMLDINSNTLLLFAPATYLAYLHFLGLYSTEGVEEAFSFLVFVAVASLYATEMQKNIDRGARRGSR